MADVCVNQPHSITPQEAKERLSQFETMLSKYGVKILWSGNDGTLKGTGVSGTVQVTDHDVKVNLKLGFLAKAAGVDPKRLEGSISRRLVDAFAA